ncbi:MULTISPECIES: hypothetical protein [unclassified Acidovorax]|uniref:hypothetical protein n=1 Tax=unclassified Acidovorax TaxID=2684926 RepID=UPI002882E617|nr:MULTISPECIES: hypothetical protein [unclassified Acidovorax]
MRSIRFAAAALLAGLCSQGAFAACYVVYSADKQVIYRSQVPPVDLSRQLHETLPRVAPGSTMVFTLDEYGCEIEINRLPGGSGYNAVGYVPRPARADRG